MAMDQLSGAVSKWDNDAFVLSQNDLVMLAVNIDYPEGRCRRSNV